MPTKNTTSPPRQEFPVGQDYVPLTEVPTLGRALIDGNVTEVGYINSFLHHLAANTHADDKEMEDLDDNRRRKRKGRRWRDNYPKVKRSSKKHKKKSKQTSNSRSSSFSFHPANAAATIAELDRYLKRRASDTGIDYSEIEHIRREPEPEQRVAAPVEEHEDACVQEESRFVRVPQTLSGELEEPVDPVAYANYQAAIAAATAATSYAHNLPSPVAYPHMPGWSLVGVPTTPHPVSPQQQALAQQCGVIAVPDHVVLHPYPTELYQPQPLSQPVAVPRLPQLAQPVMTPTYTQPPIQPTMERHRIGLVEQHPPGHYIQQATAEEQLDQFLAAHDDIPDLANLQSIVQAEPPAPQVGLELPCEPSTQPAANPPPLATEDCAESDFLEELFAWEGISCM